MTTAFLFARMESSKDLSLSHRRWNGNDRSQRNHHGAVPLAENPLDIHLRWKASPTSPTTLVGCFRLNLSSLLKSGYIRPDRKSAHVRLRFFHDNDGCVYIEVAPGHPRLLIGRT